MMPRKHHYFFCYLTLSLFNQRDTALDKVGKVLTLEHTVGKEG